MSLKTERKVAHKNASGASPNPLFIIYIKSIIATESSFIVANRFSFPLTIFSNTSICFSAVLKYHFAHRTPITPFVLSSLPK